MEDGQLLTRQAHLYRSKWSDAKLRIILQSYRYYIKRHKVNAVIVHVPLRGQQTKTAWQLIRRVEQLAKEHDCDFDLITTTELKSATGTGNVRELINRAKQLYPELRHIDKGEGKPDRLFKKLFEAVLSAYLYTTRTFSKARNTTE